MLDEQYAVAAARAQELEVAPEHWPGVIANLERMGAIGAPALAVEVEIEDELAPVWRP